MTYDITTEFKPKPTGSKEHQITFPRVNVTRLLVSEAGQAHRVMNTIDGASKFKTVKVGDLQFLIVQFAPTRTGHFELVHSEAA